MVFSRHPILQVLRHSLPWPADATPSMPRVALEVTLATPLGLLRLLNVHLEYFSERQRLAQVEALRALQREAWGHVQGPRGDAGPGGESFTFDYAFVGADLAARVRGVRVGEAARGSDHEPLLLELG